MEEFRLETERLLLKPISMVYAEEIFTEFTEEITFYMYPRPARRIQETESFIRESLIGLERGVNLQTVILHKTTEEFLGCAGLHDLDSRFPELGIWLKASAQGRAFGKEAIEGLKNWADEKLDYEYLRYPVDARNYPSRRIPEYLGGLIGKTYWTKSQNGIQLEIQEYRIFPPEQKKTRSTIQIRRATLEDASQIGAVSSVAWQTTYQGIIADEVLAQITPERQAIRCKKNLIHKKETLTLVAEANRQIVGFLTSGPSRIQDLDYRYELYALYLLPDFQRQGIGTALLDKAAELFPPLTESVCVEVLSANPNIRFYQKLGAKARLIKRLKLGGVDYETTILGW